MSDTATEHCPNPARDFATDVVRSLRHAGFEALWAGGCVRDQLLGKSPKDFDVASTATPDEVIRLFGTRRTIPVGASFGVVIVLGPTRAAGQIEVATFRSDGDYRDGRRPTTVRFCRPEEDARRRDFTINGMFFDPIADEVIDYVGGREDLAAGIIRAIGDPVARFTEDKLRLLRAVRFAATMGFRLEDRTFAAIQELRDQLRVVSVERIAHELKRMLAHASRAVGVRLLANTGLLDHVFHWSSASMSGSSHFELLLRIVSGLTKERFEPGFAALVVALASLLEHAASADRQEFARNCCRELRFSNDESDCVSWLVFHLDTIAGIANRPLHVLKPLLADERSPLLLDLSQAIARARDQQPVDADFCRDYLARTPMTRLNPAPLIDGRDVTALGIPAGPAIRTLLNQIRNEQLDELLETREQGLLRLKELAAGHS